jgi:mannosyltransferase OCH1-like enzyme
MYNAIIITTESDELMVEKFKNSNFTDKLVVYRHLYVNDILPTIWQTRNVIGNFNNPVVFPVMNVISSIYDKRFYNKSDDSTVIIAVIGGKNNILQLDYSVIKRIKDGTKSVRFIVINRVAQPKVVSRLGGKVTEIISPTAYEMFKIVSGCDYIIHNKLENTLYEHELMSGSFPMSFSVLTPLIMSNKNNDRYFKFKNIKGYERNNSSPIVLSKTTEKMWQAMMNERDEINVRNFKVISKTLENIQYRQIGIFSLHNIPKLLNFVWLNEGRIFNNFKPKKYDINLQKWREMYSDHKLIVYGMEDVLNLIEKDETIKKYKNVFLEIEPHICKCDVARLLILYSKGGYYIDHDFIPNKKIESVIDRSSDETGLCIFEEVSEHQMNKNKKLICNGFIISPPQHPFIKGLLDNILDNHKIQPKINIDSVLKRTGPEFFGDHWKEKWRNDITLLNGAIIAPLKKDGQLSNDHKSNKSIATVTIWNDGGGWWNGNDDMAGNKLEPTFSQLISNSFSESEDSLQDKIKLQKKTIIVISIIATLLFILIIIILAIVFFKKRK